jgi:tripartite ATP-independent transporter DctM subunit
MTVEWAPFVLLGGLIVLLALGIEVAIAMGVVAAIGLIFVVDKSLGQFAFTAFDSMNSFTLTAVPLFVFMGSLFAHTGTINQLFRGAEKLIGNLPGSLASAVIIANAAFGAMSGSSLAATATFGKIAYPDLERMGYSPHLSLGAIVVGGTLSVLIPPSIILVVYGGWLSVSVARLFAAGMLPGLAMAVLLVTTVTIIAKLDPKQAKGKTIYSWRERLSATKDIAPFVIIIGLILGTVFAGIMTPTESAALGALLSIIMALIYRRMTMAALKESMLTAVNITAMLAFVVFTAKMLSLVFQLTGVTTAFAEFMLALPFGKFGILLILCVMFIILGCFFDAFAMLVLTLPFVAPLLHDLGLNLTWFGILYVVLAQIGLVTPPFGLNLFVLHNVLPQFSLLTIFRGALPFLIPLFIIVALLIAFPEFALWLPGKIY